LRRKIVTVMPVTAVFAVGLFARPLAVLVAKYLVDDERGDPQPRRRPHRAERHRRSRPRQPDEHPAGHRVRHHPRVLRRQRHTRDRQRPRHRRRRRMSLPRRDQELPLPALFDELRRDHHATLADAGDAGASAPPPTCRQPARGARSRVWCCRRCALRSSVVRCWWACTCWRNSARSSHCVRHLHHGDLRPVPPWPAAAGSNWVAALEW
jgi:hypothetical protein